MNHERHFESMERQKLAATLGLWVFLASEVLFFGTLFTAYAYYRAQAPEAFARAVQHNTLYLGSGNTLVLLTSSFLVALAVHFVRRGHSKWATRLVYGTVALGIVFLSIKGWEYRLHFHEGIYPGGQGSFFDGAHELGAVAFWNMYFLMTGLHALHVTIGIGLLAVAGVLVSKGIVGRDNPQIFENIGVYWHLVDVIWLFLWPCFYLTNGAAG